MNCFEHRFDSAVCLCCSDIGRLHVKDPSLDQRCLFLWWCFCGGGGVAVVIWWWCCCAGAFVWCFCGCVVVVFGVGLKGENRLLEGAS